MYFIIYFKNLSEWILVVLQQIISVNILISSILTDMNNASYNRIH